MYQDLSKPEFNNIFDVTLTYRHNADIVYRYGALINKTTKEIIKNNDFLKFQNLPINLTNYGVTELTKRPKDIAWVVSHCQTPSLREEYVKQMKKQSNSLKIDIFGKCGSKYLSKDSGLEASYGKLASVYKFYLSFENAKCYEYITEKFFLALHSGMIPVAMGGLSKQDYEKIAPPHSFLHIDDFLNVQELMETLNKLSKNPDAYHSYFWWKEYYDVTIYKTEDPNNFINTRAKCQFCDLLHIPYFYASKNAFDYRNFKNYWNKCR